jgi:hypothetical protein
MPFMDAPSVRLVRLPLFSGMNGAEKIAAKKILEFFA